MEELDLKEAMQETGMISDINVTPFIDIMLVLLIIFMVTAPLMMGGVQVNLPKSNGDPMPRPTNPTIISLSAENRIFVDEDEVPVDKRQDIFKQLAKNSETGEAFVRGDGEVKYAKMVELMSELGQAGFARVTLVTNIQGGSGEKKAPQPGPTTAATSDDSGPQMTPGQLNKP